MAVTLGALLAAQHLRLRLVGDGGSSRASGDRAVTWVHSSDLEDPTPFLDPSQVLLTDGTQLPVASTDPQFVDAYVARLAQHGVAALGFATQVVHGTVPPALRDACGRHGVPLFEVPERIPFIAIIRHVADAIAAEQHAALTARLDASRAIARAARRPDALTAIMRELERLLGTWVALYDASGEQLRIEGLQPPPADARSELRSAVLAALTRRHGGTHRISSETVEATLQTVGSNQRRLGVLAIGDVASTDARDELVGNAVAFAGVALDQEYALLQSRLAVREAAFALLRQGRLQHATTVLRGIRGAVPAEPVVALVATAPSQVVPLSTSLEMWVHSRGGFFAIADGEVVIVCREHDVASAEELLSSAATVGVSDAGSWSGFAHSLHGARRARAEAERRGASTLHVVELTSRGHLGLIPGDDATFFAAQTLKVIRGGPDGSSLLDTVVAWMRHNCSWARTAEELGLHRHSVRARVDATATLLGEDLDSAGGRARLWTALALAGLV